LGKAHFNVFKKLRRTFRTALAFQHYQKCVENNCIGPRTVGLKRRPIRWSHWPTSGSFAVALYF